ncbi:MAG: hypothetical protein COB66_00785 [Coxiella sp. (in: Bacteria)]|nr:MAG: hypothetical protein COB66_00785 [Coxiella sp. (in: g-proteobacteria)]
MPPKLFNARERPGASPPHLAAAELIPPAELGHDKDARTAAARNTTRPTRSPTPQLTLREELLNYPRKPTLQNGLLIMLAWQRYGDKLRLALDEDWGVERLLLILNNPSVNIGSDRLQNESIKVIASFLHREFHELSKELGAAPDSECQEVTDSWETHIYQTKQAAHVATILNKYYRKDTYYRKDKFEEIAELYLSLKITNTNPELKAILDGEIGRDFGLQFLLTQATTPYTFQQPTVPPRLAFKHQSAVWDHNFRVDDKNSYRHPLEVLSGNYFMRQCGFLFKLTFNLQLARNYFHQGYKKLALSSLQTACKCWRALPKVILSSIGISPNRGSILSQQTSIDETNFGRYFDDIAATVVECRPHILIHLQKPLALNDLEAIYAKIVMNQAEITYLEHTTDMRNPNQAELFKVIPDIHSLFVDQLKLASKAVEHHPGPGHFMQGTIFYNLSRFLLLLNKLPLGLFNRDTFFRAHPEIQNTLTGNYLKYRRQGTELTSAIALVKLACERLKFAVTKRPNCHRAEANCFSLSPKGFDDSALLEPNEPATSLKELLASYQDQHQQVELKVAQQRRPRGAAIS